MSIKINKPSLSDNGEAIKLITTLLSKYSVIPDLFDIINDPVLTFKVLQGLAGLTVRFPSLESIKAIIIASDIVLRMEMNSDVDKNTIIKSISKDYGILADDIEVIYEKVRKKLIKSNEEDIQQLTAVIFESLIKNKKLNATDILLECRIKNLQVVNK